MNYLDEYLKQKIYKEVYESNKRDLINDLKDDIEMYERLNNVDFVPYSYYTLNYNPNLNFFTKELSYKRATDCKLSYFLSFNSFRFRY